MGGLKGLVGGCDDAGFRSRLDHLQVAGGGYTGRGLAAGSATALPGFFSRFVSGFLV